MAGAARVSLKGRTIVLGVTGSVAAYKAADVLRRFQDRGASVRCVLTPNAAKFVSPLTLSALSGHPVAQDVTDESSWNMAHLGLAKSADAVLVAPASADFIARLAQGRADTLLGALVLATRKPVFIAPAMHEPMWTHPATAGNAARCKEYGYAFIGPASGPLASGDSGLGRLESPENIVDAVAAALGSRPKSRR